MWQGCCHSMGRPGTHVLLQVELLLAWHRGADFGLGEVFEAAGALEGELGETERCGGSPCAPSPSSHPPLRQPGCSASQSSPGAMLVLEEFFWLSQLRPSCPNPTRATVCCEPPPGPGVQRPSNALGARTSPWHSVPRAGATQHCDTRCCRPSSAESPGSSTRCGCSGTEPGTAELGAAQDCAVLLLWHMGWAFAGKTQRLCDTAALLSTQM